MSFPLFNRPGAVVLLDDDPDYLDMLALVLPKRWQVKLFIHPRQCIDHLQQEPARWEADAWVQQGLVNHALEGKPIARKIIDYWANTPARFDLTRVCVVDFSMPGMDGLQVLSELEDWQGSRVLLTGRADQRVAINAFNQGLIDQFITKQTADITRCLIETIEQLMWAASPRHSQIWRTTLTATQHAQLVVPSVLHDLGQFAATHWIEHVVIGQPFGVLGVDAKGNISWLQLEPREGLLELSQLAHAEGLGATAVDSIREGKGLVDIEMSLALDCGEANRLANCFAVKQLSANFR